MTTIEDLKVEARRLRAALAEAGQPISHSQSLEMLAKQRGRRDWNTLHASVGNRPPGPPVAVGQQVGGVYLGKRFAAEVRAVRALGDGRFRVTLDLDEPVNVSAFESFDVLRRRISASIRRSGETVERTSNGAPQLSLAL